MFSFLLLRLSDIYYISPKSVFMMFNNTVSSRVIGSGRFRILIGLLNIKFFILSESKIFLDRSSCSQMFFKIGVLKNFATFKTPAQVFSCEHCKIFKNIYLEKHMWLAAFESVFLSWNIILNLLWKTYFMCILLSDCTNTFAIRLKNRRA